MKWQGSARAWLSLLHHGPKVMDVLETSLDLGLLSLLDAGPVTLATLSFQLEAVPGRLYKLLDCLESIGLVKRVRTGNDVNETTYESVEPLVPAALAVVGPESVEVDRDRHPWRSIYGKLKSVVRGQEGIPREAFDWPPRTDEQIASFETSMALGCPPIIESFLANSNRIFRDFSKSGADMCVLDVGGGDGTLGVELSRAMPSIHVDVFNLPSVQGLVEKKIEAAGLASRMKFVGGDFLKESLPTGYDVLSFVRVLHDWPDSTAVELLRNAFNALSPKGRVLICEEFRTPDRLAVQFFWSYFLIGLDQCVSRLREADFYARILAEIGFVEIQCLPGPFEIIVAVRP